MSDDAGFFKAMAANPTDSLTPLVYADWFDERNDPRGQLLRVWVDLSWRASHAGHGFRDLLDEFRRLLGGVDPDWRREFGAHRPWVDARLAEELTRGCLRYVERRPPGQRGVISNAATWFDEPSEPCGWMVPYWTGRPCQSPRDAEQESRWLWFVQPEFGWVYGMPTCGPRGWFQRFDLESGQGHSF